ncbi:rap domain protein, partial [Nannochloropsis oceanica]
LPPLPPSHLPVKPQPGEAFYGLFLKECLEKHKAMVAELKRRKDAREKREAERIAIEREERDRREKLRAEREAAATAAAAEGQKKAKEDDNTAAEGVAAAAAAAAAKVGEGGETESEYRSRGGGGEGGGEGGERGQEAAAAGAEGAKEAVKEDRVSIFQARDVAAILQALVVLYQLDATRYTPPPAFLDAFGQHTVDADDTDNSLDRFHGTDMAIAVNCLATLGHPPPDSTLAALADTCLRRRFEGFEGQGLANLIQVMASLGHDPGRRFLESFVDACLHRRTLDTLEIQDATSLLHGLALVKHHPGDRFLSRFLPSVLLPFRHAVEECAPVSVHGMLPPTSTRK